MAKRRFEIQLSGTAVIEIDDAVIDAVTDEWRGVFYSLYTPEEIAEMVGRCMVVYGSRLSMLDGWADQPDENARIIEYPDWDGEARELP